MKKLNGALQYTVYDLGNGRVFKKANSYSQQEGVLRSWNYKTKSSRDKKLNEINLILRNSNSGIKNIIYRKKSLGPLLGNPLFESDDDYTQDKVIPLGEYIRKHSLNQNKTIIDEYAKLTHQLWSYGVHDLIFNFTLNNGVTKNGTVIQLDFGECDFTKSKLKKHITSKMWLLKESYKHLAGTPLQAYVAEKLNKEFTIAKMDQLWKSKF